MRTMIVASWVTSAVIVAWALATVLSGFFICRPFAKNWLPNLEGTCGDQRLSYTITGSLNLVTDLVAMVLPLPYLWGLRMQLKKLLLAIAFSMGIL